MFCNVGQLQQIQKGAAHECKAAVSCKTGPPEYLEEDNPALDGDVGDSLAMNNHKLLKAARNGNVEGIIKMLKKRAFIETRRPFVMTPETVTAPEPSFMRGEGLTPLMCAAQGGYEDACRILLRHGACANAEDEDGMRPLHYAASSGCVDTCRALLAGGAESGAQDDDGLTALEHVPPEDLMTAAEKRLWHGVLGVKAAEGVAKEEPEVSPEPPSPGGTAPGGVDLLGPDCQEAKAAEEAANAPEQEPLLMD